MGMKTSAKYSSEFRVVCIQTGLCKFIPLPFIDDMIIARLRRRMVRRIFNETGIQYRENVPDILAKWKTESLGRRFLALLKGLIIKPLRKLFRTVFFWLTVRDAGRIATETYLLARFLRSDAVTESDEPLDPEIARHLADAFGEAVKYCEKDVAKVTWSKIWTRLRRWRNKMPGGVVKESVPGFLTLFDTRYNSVLKRTSRA